MIIEDIGRRRERKRSGGRSAGCISKNGVGNRSKGSSVDGIEIETIKFMVVVEKVAVSEDHKIGDVVGDTMFKSLE